MKSRVRLRIETRFPGRLLRRAMEEGAVLHRISRPDDRTLLLSADPRSAARLRALCERFSVPCHELERSGPDALMRRLKRRCTLPVGILVCMMLVSAFLSRVWLIDIELTGGRAASIVPIGNALSSLGVRPGVARSSVDPKLLADELSAVSDEFSFVGVRLDGVRLLIEAVPAVPGPELYNPAAVCDLVADRDGVVLAMNVQAGVACVEPGDTVVRGQVLIRGEERVSAEETAAVAARGSVIARSWLTGEASAPLVRTETLRTGRSSRSDVLSLAGFSRPILNGEVFLSQECETEILPIGGLFLPLELQRTTRYETRPTTVRQEEAGLKRALAALATADARMSMRAAHPAAERPAVQWTEYSLDSSGVLTARVIFEMHTDVAVTRDRLVQQGGTVIGNE